MASRPSRRWLVAATAASAALWFVGTGLHPVPWLTWVAPVPAFIVALRGTAAASAAVAFLGYAAGALGLGHYLAVDLETPLPVAALSLVALAAIVTAVVLLLHALARAGRRGLALIVVPAAWTSAEYAVSVLTAAGTNWSLGNTQADLLPVLQLASLGGIVAVSFLVVLVATAIAVVVVPVVPRRTRVGAVVLALSLLAATVAFGSTRMTGRGVDTVRVALVAAQGPGYIPAAASPDGRRLLESDLAWLRDLDPDAPDAVDLVVFPEKDVLVDEDDEQVLHDVAAVARERRVTVVLGVAERAADHVQLRPGLSRRRLPDAHLPQAVPRAGSRVRRHARFHPDVPHRPPGDRGGDLRRSRPAVPGPRVRRCRCPPARRTGPRLRRGRLVAEPGAARPWSRERLRRGPCGATGVPQPERRVRPRARGAAHRCRLAVHRRRARRPARLRPDVLRPPWGRLQLAVPGRHRIRPRLAGSPPRVRHDADGGADSAR